MEQLLKIPFSRPYFPDEHEIMLDIQSVLRSGWLTSAHEVQMFEAEFAKYIGTDYAVAVNSGTAALHSILLSLGIGKGDEVIVPANTFVATANAVTYTGAKPVFADSDKDTFNISPIDVINKTNKNTKAIILVHLGGNPCNIGRFKNMVENTDIHIIEDCAHATGSKYMTVGNCGASGLANAFSFYPNKVMTTGEGGMVTTNDKRIADKVRLIRNQGRGGYGPLEITELGYNYRMSDINAVIGRHQLKWVDDFIRRRMEVVLNYNQLWNKIDWIKPQKIIDGMSSFYAYIVKVLPDAPITRDMLVKRLQDVGISTSVLYHPVPEQPLYLGTGNEVTVPEASYLGRQSLALPMYCMYPNEEEYLISQLEKICQNV